jgi:ATP-dependent protease ClpP protease subunit
MLENEFKELEIIRFAYAKGVILDLMENEYEFLIQDMQMPINRNGSIDIAAGMYVFNQLKYRKIKIKLFVALLNLKKFLMT